MLADEGKAKAIAFDEIDKAPEEKKRGITIATVGTYIIHSGRPFWPCSQFHSFDNSCPHDIYLLTASIFRHMLSMRLRNDTMPMLTALDMQIMSK